MRAAIFASILAAGLLSVIAATSCNDQSLNPCSVDLQIQVDVAAASVTDCGTFDIGSDNYNDMAMLSAQLCVINAISASQNFRLSYDAQITDGMIVPGNRAGWDGIYDPVTMKMTLRVYAGRGGGDLSSTSDLVSVQSCDSVEPVQNCTPAIGYPCLSCVKSTTTPVATVSCRG